MLTTNEPNKVKDLFNQYETPKGEPYCLLLEFPIQRPAGQWNIEKKSRFVHAILQGDPIPPLYITCHEKDVTVPRMLLDGVQRLTTLYTYIKGYGKRAMKLWSKTPDVEVVVFDKDSKGNQIYNSDGTAKTHIEIIKIAGKTFKQLPTQCQKALLNFTFDCKMLSQYTNADLSRIMYNLNNGQSATATQKAIMKLGMNLGEEIQNLTECDLFENCFSFTDGDEKKSEAHKCVLYSLIQWTGQKNDDVSYTKLNSTSLNSFAEYFSGTWSYNDLNGISSIFDTLYDMLPEDKELYSPFMKATHLPVFVMNVDTYLSIYENGKITEEQYRDFLTEWFTTGIYSKEFEQFTVDDNKNISSKSNIEGRIKLMDNALLNFVNNGEISFNDPDDIEELTVGDSAIEKMRTKTEISDIANNDVKDFIEQTKEKFNCDEDAAINMFINTSNDFYQGDDNRKGKFVEYINTLTYDKVLQYIENAKVIFEFVPKNYINEFELSVYVSLVKAILEDDNIRYFDKWQSDWNIEDDEEYINMLIPSDFSNNSQTALVTYLLNNFNNYINSAREETL